MLDAGELGARLLRVARLDDGVFESIRSDESGHRIALLLPAALFFGAAVAAYVYMLALFGTGNLDHAALLVRQLLMGTAVGYGTWFAWTLVAERVLERLGAPVVREELLRVLGYAALPWAIVWLFWVPETVQDAAGSTMVTRAGIVVIGVALVVLWPLWSLAALRAASPSASTRVLVTAAFAAHVEALVLLWLAATWFGVAPAISVYEGDTPFYG